MNIGTVVFFNTIKGFGFIKNDETEVEIFFYVSAIVGASILYEGQKVYYDVGKDPKSYRDRAENISVAEDSLS